MNYLREADQLRNTYYILRHGKSLANEARLIVSNPEDGIAGYGLSDEGRRQITGVIERAVGEGIFDRSTLIVSSDFARARESAVIARALVGTGEITLDSRLRERYFGDWDGQDDSNYGRVWAKDAADGEQKYGGVESTYEVLDRTTSLMSDLEAKYEGRTILLVSHGDALQILQTAFEGIEPGKHRQVPNLETAGLRRLEFRAATKCNSHY